MLPSPPICSDPTAPVHSGAWRVKADTRPSAWRAALLLWVAVGLVSCGGSGDNAPAGSAEGVAGPALGAAPGRAKALAITPQQAARAQWSAPIQLSIVPAAAAVLGNGKVLFWAANNRTSFGGLGRTYTSLFDPATNLAAEALISNTSHDMFCPGTAMLADGRLLVNGGLDAGTTSIYDPLSNSWTRAANMANTRGYNASTTLGDGSVLTVGGSWSGGVRAKDSELFTLAGGWRTLSGISTSDSALLTSDPGGLYRSDNHMWLVPTGNGRVLHAGPGKNMNWLDVRGNGSMEPAGLRADDTDSMSGNAVMYDSGKILTVGGSLNYGGTDGKRDAFVIDTTGGLADTRRVGSMTYPRVYANSVVLPNGQVVVIGGQTFGQGFSDSNSVLPTEIFDPETETFTLMPPISVPRNYHSVALLLPDGRVVSAGGGLCNCAADHPDLQLLSPPYLFNSDGSAATRPVITSAPATVGYGTTATVNTGSAVTSFALVRLGATTHTVNNDQRRVALSFTALGGNSYSLNIPSNPGILLPGQWMLFAMNAQGTPSVARIVSVNGSNAPVLSNPGAQEVNLGGAVNLPAQATTPSGALSFSASGLPGGLSIDPSTGSISGTATQAGSFVVTLRASNGSQTVSTDITLSIVQPGTGTGLLAQYFNTTTLSGPVALQRLERPDFNWATTAPGPGVQADPFSARWSGWLEAPATGTFRLRTLSDDGVRVWLDGRLVIDNWINQAVAASNASVALAAGQRYAVMVEYYDGGGSAEMRLQWRPPGASSFAAVPLNRLYPAPAPSTNNIALGRATSQSSTFETATAARAVDGNTDGVYRSPAATGSVMHTNGSAPQDWWQVDLGQLADIAYVKLWNRTDCCSNRLVNFTLLVSSTPMGSRSLSELVGDPSVLKRQVAVSNITPQINLPVGAQGRHVRVQLNGTAPLHLAEVQVYGEAAVIYRTPTMSAIAAQTSTLGVAATLQVVATELDGRALGYSASGLPAGLSINATTGRISGTPAAAGSANVSVSAGNAGGLSASRSFTWVVEAGGLPTVSDVPAPIGAAGSLFSYAPVLSGGPGSSYSWNFGDGSATTSFTSSAAATHRFTQPGVYSVTLNIRAANGSTGVYSFLQAVAPAAGGAPAQASSNILIEARSAGADRLWVLNADHDTVSVFDAGTRARLAEIAVGQAPRAMALGRNNQIWVVNKDSASISVVDSSSLAVARTVVLPRASQPYGIVVAPSDGAAYVSLQATGRVLKLSEAGATLQDRAVGDNPRHLALAGNGSQLLVSRFITRALPGESSLNVQTSAGGQAVGGEVLRLNPSNLALLGTTVLAHSELADSEAQGRGIPNYLGAAAISPDSSVAWVPSKQDNLKRGSARDGLPLDFQNTVRAVSSRINLSNGNEEPAARVDHDNASLASAALYHPSGAYLMVALETSRQVAVVDASGQRELFRLETGIAPQGLAISSDGRRLYVHNFMSRSVSEFDLQPLLQSGQRLAAPAATLAAVSSEALSPAVLRGKQLFYDARDPRLSRDSYMSCASCHNDGGHDGRTWDFTHAGEGLRNTIALRGRAGAQGRLHWSANFDEVQDFEGQIRAFAGGTGLMTDAQFNAGTRRQPLGERKAGLSNDLDALAAYVASLNSFDSSPYRQANGALTAQGLSGKAVFESNCVSCHLGGDFSDSSKSVLHDVGSRKTSSGQRLGQTLNGLDAPTLRDVWATAPYLHDGSAATLEAAIGAHTRVGLTATELTNVVSYVRQIGNEEGPTAAPSANLVVRAFSTLLNQVGALFEVRVNSQVVGSGQVDATSWIELFYNVANLVKDSIVEVVFKNDQSSASEDRNLVVPQIRVNGSTTLEATGPEVVLDPGAGAGAFDGIDLLPGASTGGWLPWDAAIRFKVPATGTGDTITLRARATLAAGVGAQVELRLNGVVVGSTLIASAVVTDFVFNTPAVQAGDAIDVVFVNDANIAGQDRNLFVASVLARGNTLAPTDPGVLIDRGAGAAAFDGLDTVPASSIGGWIPWNGALRLTAR